MGALVTSIYTWILYTANARISRLVAKISGTQINEVGVPELIVLAK